MARIRPPRLRCEGHGREVHSCRAWAGVSLRWRADASVSHDEISWASSSITRAAEEADRWLWIESDPLERRSWCWLILQIVEEFRGVLEEASVVGHGSDGKLLHDLRNRIHGWRTSQLSTFGGERQAHRACNNARESHVA